MFDDAAVYGMSWYAVGRASADKHRAARVSGSLQVLLALLVLFEVILAGALVQLTRSPWPNLVVGTTIAVFVLAGGWKILKLSIA